VSLLEDAIVSESSVPLLPDSAAARWADRLARFAIANQSVAAFCLAEGVTTSKFYQWRRRLALPTTHTPNQPTVVPLRVAPTPAHTTPIELALPSGVLLRFPADTRPELLVAVLRGLEKRPC
jgi:hypothetical protein